MAKRKPIGRQPKRISSVTEMSQIMAVSTNTVREWRKVPTFPSTADGSVAVVDLVRWVDARTGGNPFSAPGETVQQTKSDAETRKANAQADIAEIRARVMREELIDKRSIIAACCVQAAVVRSRLQSIPGELSSSFAADTRDDVRMELENGIGLILVEISQMRLDGLALAEVQAAVELLKSRQKQIDAITVLHREEFTKRKGGKK